MTTPAGSSGDNTNLNRNLNRLAKMTQSEDITAYRYYLDDKQNLQKRNIFARAVTRIIRAFKNPDNRKLSDSELINTFAEKIIGKIAGKAAEYKNQNKPIPPELFKNIDNPKIGIVLHNIKKQTPIPSVINADIIRQFSDLSFEQLNKGRHAQFHSSGSVDLEAQTNALANRDGRAAKFLKYLENDPNPNKWNMIKDYDSVNQGSLSIEEIVLLAKSVDYYLPLVVQTSMSSGEQTKYEQDIDSLHQLKANTVKYLQRELGVEDDGLFRILVEDTPISTLYENLDDFTFYATNREATFKELSDHAAAIVAKIPQAKKNEKVLENLLNKAAQAITLKIKSEMKTMEGENSYKKLMENPQWSSLLEQVSRDEKEQDHHAMSILDIDFSKNPKLAEVFQAEKNEYAKYLETKNKLIDVAGPEDKPLALRYANIVNYLKTFSPESKIHTYLSEDEARKKEIIQKVLKIDDKELQKIDGHHANHYSKAFAANNILQQLASGRLNTEVYKAVTDKTLNEDNHEKGDAYEKTIKDSENNVLHFGLDDADSVKKNIVQFDKYCRLARSVDSSIKAIAANDTSVFTVRNATGILEKLNTIHDTIMLTEAKYPDFADKLPEDILNSYKEAKDRLDVLTKAAKDTVKSRITLENVENPVTTSAKASSVKIPAKPSSDWDSLLALSRTEDAKLTEETLQKYRILENRFLALEKQGDSKSIDNYQDYKKQMNILGIRLLPIRARLLLESANGGFVSKTNFLNEFRKIERSWLLYPEHKDYITGDIREFNQLQGQIARLTQLKK